MKIPKEAALRFLKGGLCGLAVMFGVVFLIEFLGAGIRGVFHWPTLIGHGAEVRFGSHALALLVQSVLMFALGGMAGIATLPFAETAGALLGRSILHFLVTALFYSLLLVFCFDLIPALLPAWLGLLLTLYLVIWLARYVGWYVELQAIREKLGLSAGPSPLKWRETLPYLPFLLILCVGLPVLGRWCAAVGVPVLYPYVIFPFLILPVGCFAAGFSLGKRRGFCVLYAAIALLFCLLAKLPEITGSNLCECLLIAGAALLGNGAGAMMLRLRKGAVK